MKFATCTLAGVCVLAIVGGVAIQTAVGAGTTVNAKLREMTVGGVPAKVAAGRVTFVARNLGSVPHELVVVRRPSSGTLRVASFKAEEHGLAVGEVEEIEPGQSGRVTLTLKPGRYLLICNIVGHYQLGMQAELVATSRASAGSSP